MESLDTIPMERKHLGWFADSMRQAAAQLDNYSALIIREAVDRAVRLPGNKLDIMDLAAKDGAKALVLADELRRYAEALEVVL